MTATTDDGERFGATLSPTMKVFTYLVGYGVVLGVSLVVTAKVALAKGSFAPLAFPLLLALILFAASRFRPTGFTITRDELRVERPIGPVRVPLDDVAAVVNAAEYLRGRSIGLFRVGGFYGTYGRFWNREAGAFDVYVTGSYLIAIRRSRGRALVVSPDEPGRFVDVLERRARERGLTFPIHRAHTAD